MRLARLDLMRFGLFTDARVELPNADRDFHMVFGANEAGKTTTLTAVEDLLFGIHPQSPYGFLHKYDAMRLGAVLENGAERLEFLRRKGTKDTVLGPDGLPLPGGEHALTPYVGRADRAFFDNMFNLSHVRLAEGGAAILAARDDVGQMLFSAGTGLTDIRERLARLEAEADDLWSARKSKRRLYYQAESRLQEATREQREHTVTAARWGAARKSARDAEDAVQDVRHAYEAASAEQKKLQRIRRVYGLVRREHEIAAEIEGLADVAMLPEDAGHVLTEAERQGAEISAHLAVLAPRLEQAQARCAALEVDDRLVLAAQEIGELDERRIEVRKGRTDLPHRRSELETMLAELTRLASDFGWPTADPFGLAECIPQRGKLERLRSLISDRGECRAALRATSRALAEARAELSERSDRLTDLGEPADTSRLAAVLTDVRERGDLAGRIRTAELQIAELTERIQRRIEALKPPLPVKVAIETLAVPAREWVELHRDAVRDRERREHETTQRLAEERDALQRDRESLQRRIRAEGIVTEDELQAARGNRDTLWQIVKLRYIEQAPIPAEEAQVYAAEFVDLPPAFEKAMRQADADADRRHETAHAEGALAEVERAIGEREVLVEQLGTRLESLAQKGAHLDERWRALWGDVPIAPGSPEAMLAWLDTRDDVVADLDRSRERQRELGALRDEEQGARGLLTAELAALGVESDALQTDSLRVVMEQAEAFRRSQESLSERRTELVESVRAASTALVHRQREEEEAREAWSAWHRDWSSAVAAIGLAADAETSEAVAIIDTIEGLRERLARATEHRDRRIVAIERDIAAYENQVANAVATLDPDLKETPADDAVLELVRRRDQAIESDRQRRELSRAIEDLRTEIEVLEVRRREAQLALEPLKKAAGVEDVDSLRAAILQSDRHRTLHQETSENRDELARQGDGLGIDTLEAECRDIEIDQVRAREETLESELKGLQERLGAAIAHSTDAQRAFDEIGGDDLAARAAAARQESLAAMQDAAVRYVRLRASAVLLRWAIDRYGREKQGPLLRRASELFRVLTRDSFERLAVDFDERENMHLTGIRPDGEVVSIDGLSTGSEDQLYLALRIAAIEDYLERAPNLPFVADDLFINFDAERSAAGFDVLGALAERTQVLFFTYHAHLVDVARQTLGNDIHVVDLANAG